MIVEPGREPEQTPETEVVATIVKDFEDPLTTETLLYVGTLSPCFVYDTISPTLIPT